LRQEETNTSIQHIKALVQEQMAALNIREKNEICASKERPKKAYEELTANEENINDIRSIRKESIRASVKEEADGLAQEQVCQVIAMLREQEKKPATATMPERGTKSEYPCPEQNWQTPNDLEEKLRKKEQKPHVTKTDRRITFRLDPVLLEKVQQYSQNTGIELSMIVRQALTQLLEADVTSKETANAELPQSALSLTGKYQVWGSDLREELWMQFLRTLAAAYVTTRRWHRDERSHRLYEGLIRLYRKLEGNNVRQI
jgi:predicted DNA binding CopG/RHH family protein